MKRQTSHDTTASFLEEPTKTGSSKKSALKEAQYTIVKRSGTIVPFRRDRILNAIEAAFKDTKKTELLDSEQQHSVNHITDLVVKQLLTLASKGASLTVEGIQDVVEVTLMKNGHHDVARDYIIYRDNRKLKRAETSQNLKIYRRDKTTPTRFNPMKIASSLERAFRRARNIQEQTTDDAIAAVNDLTKKIVSEIAELAAKGYLYRYDRRSN
jgi:ribonucleoside-diphosphate reductase alpha chain